MKFKPLGIMITSCGLQMCKSKIRTFSLIAHKRGTSGMFRRNLIKDAEYTNLTMAGFRILNNFHTPCQLRSSQENLTEKLVKCFEELKNTEYSTLTVVQVSNHKLQNFKNLVFEVAGKRINFTEVEKERIAIMLYEILKHMDRNVKLLPPSATKEEVLPSLPTKEELVECLQEMIEYSEYTDPTVVRGKKSLDLIPEVGRGQKDFAEKFVKCIKELKNTDYSKPGVARASHAMVTSFLRLLFEVGINRINFTEGEQRQIGNLLVDIVEPVRRNVEFTRDILFRSCPFTSVLIKRSALEFLVEDYGQFPARSSTLENELAKGDIQASIKILDIVIDVWWESFDLSEESFGEEAVPLCMPLYVPDTHTWWLEY